MKTFANVHKKRITVSLLSVILCSVMIFGCACQNGNTFTSDTAETSAADAAHNETDSGTETESTSPDQPPSKDVSEYKDLVISKVYGNGGSSNAVCEHSFIELKNTGSSPLCLSGLALYYMTGKAAEYTAFELPGVTLEAGASYLIRGVSSTKKTAKYDSSDEIIRIEYCDTEWDTAIDNKDVKLLLSYAGRKLGGTTPPEELDGVISYFVASDKYNLDTGYVTGYSKKKMAVRTAMKQDSGYYLQNLSKSTTEQLEQTAPETSDGKRAAVICSKLSEVRFSAAAGFYEEPFSLELTAPPGYETVYYTVDGSDPVTSKTRKKYTKPIALSDTANKEFGRTYVWGLNFVGNISSPTPSMIGGHVIKACACHGENYTGVYTNSYFISSEMAKYGTTVMSVSLEKEQMFGDPGFYHNFNGSSNDPNTRGKAFMEVFDENGVRRGYSNVELAVSGHGSAGAGMRSMKVFYKGSENTADGTDPKLNYDLFDGYATNAKGQSITDFSRLVLRNSGNDCGNSYIRDAFMQRVSRNMYADSMAYAPVLLFINGDFWGVYNARERYSGDYVQSHYGIDKDNVAIIESDYSQVHTNQNAPFVVTSGLETDADEFNELVDFIRNNSMEQEENYQYVCEKIDIDSLIDLFVCRIYFSCVDFPGNNIKVWHNRAASDPSGADNKWHFVLLDLDMGISFYKDGVITTENSNYYGWVDDTSTVASSIVHYLMANGSFKERYLSRFYQVLNEVYVADVMDAELDKIVAERASIEHLLTLRWGANPDYYNMSVSDMHKFIKNRGAYALRYLCDYFRVNEDYLISISGNYLSMKFSETRLNVTVNGDAVQSPWSVKFDKSVTVDIKAEAKEGFELSSIIFTDKNGKKTSCDGSTAKITTDISGQISFETKKLSRPTDLAVNSGIVAGGCEMYYLSPDGKLYAWGSNTNNVLGAGVSKQYVTTPELVYENVAQIQICHGNDYENRNDNVAAAVLTLDGDIYTIGAPVIPGVDVGSSWKLLEYDGTPVQVSVGFDHLLVLDKDGSVWGIGNNSYGQLGKENEGGTVTSFIKIADNAVMISAGRRNTAYIDTNGDCYVLGDGRWHKFRQSEENINVPYKLLSGVNYITSGEHELLMVTEDGGLYYAGWRSLYGFSQGAGSGGAQRLDITGVSKAAIHHGDIAIMTESGALYAYGINNGNCTGVSAVEGTPALILNDGVKDVAAGFAFIAYLDSNGRVRVNGSNAEGQAGDGTVTEYVSWPAVEIK